MIYNNIEWFIKKITFCINKMDSYFGESESDLDLDSDSDLEELLSDNDHIDLNTKQRINYNNNYESFYDYNIPSKYLNKNPNYYYKKIKKQLYIRKSNSGFSIYDKVGDDKVLYIKTNKINSEGVNDDKIYIEMNLDLYYINNKIEYKKFDKKVYFTI